MSCLRFSAGAMRRLRRSASSLPSCAIVNRDRRLMPVLHGPDDVLGTPGRVAAEEHAGTRRLHREAIDGRHVVLIEVDADVALDPGKGVLLPDREDDVVAR